MPGPFYISWADFGETFGPQHLVFDMRVISFNLAQDENGVATLDIVCPNPREGLLNPDAQQYVFFSRKNYHNDDVRCLFYGRIIAIPDRLEGDRVRLQFRAEPEDFQDIKVAFADTLKVLPYYDRLFVSDGDQEDPDTVLLARTANFHLDRVSHALTLSDNFSGEDGLIAFATTEVLRSSVDLQIGEPATDTVNFNAKVSWVQKATGIVDVTRNLNRAFALAGSEEPFGISSYTMDVLIENWPLPGDTIGGGWTVEETVVIDGTNRWVSPEQYAANLITMYAAQNPFNDIKDLLEQALGAQINDGVFVNDTTARDIPLTSVKPSMIIRYDAERARNEELTFTMRCDMQPILSDPGGTNIKHLALSSNDAGELIDPGPAAPIGDVRRRFYFKTDRGRQSVEYCLLRARAELLDNARAIEISFNVRFSHIFDVTLRKSASIIDPRLPGGFAAGKIVRYSASLDGNVGLALCNVTIACSVGKGNILTAEAGDPDYVQEGYVQPGYQTYSNKLVLVAGDLAYTDYTNAVSDDDGLDFFNIKPDDVVLSVIVTNGPDTQRAALELNRFRETNEEIDNEIEEVQTNVCMNFKPVRGGPYTTNYALEVTGPVAPRGINLEAETSV